VRAHADAGRRARSFDVSPLSLPDKRSSRVDVLRGLAILSVLLLHFSLTYHLADGPWTVLIPAAFIRALVNNGNYGVTLFFVMSGFLISSNNLRRFGALSAVRLSSFYAFRFARIVPPLLLALAIIVPLGLAHVPSFDNVQHAEPLPRSFFFVVVLSVLTFWHNVLMEWRGYFNYCLNIYWSLSVEEVFYLTFPLACLLLRRRALIVALCVAAIAFAPLYRFWHRDDELFFMYGYPACFDAIAFGCLTALLSADVSIGERQGRVLRIFAWLGIAATYLAGIDRHEVFGFSIIALFASVLLFGALRSATAPGWAARCLAWLGRHSYELYLFHIVVLGALRDLWPRSEIGASAKLPLLALFLLMSCALAAAIARYFADPLNGWLRRRLAPT
jgi:peptidoglycan/LPS O-acetylase OafA/YrhL